MEELPGLVKIVIDLLADEVVTLEGWRQDLFTGDQN